MDNSPAFRVYLLDGEFGLYIGQTDNLKRRIRQHRTGRCYTSSRIGAFRLGHKWAFETRLDALRVEALLQQMQADEGDSAVWGLALDHVSAEVLAKAALGVRVKGESKWRN